EGEGEPLKFKPAASSATPVTASNTRSQNAATLSPRALKRSPGDLALFGGPPAFAEPLHVGRPNMGDRSRFLTRVEEILDRRWFTNDGPCVREFEARLAARLGVTHVIATCNATA